MDPKFQLEQSTNKRLTGSGNRMGSSSKVLKPAKARHNTFGQELLAIYLAIKHLRQIHECRHFCVLADHKASTHVFDHNSEKFTPRENFQLRYISKFTAGIPHVQGKAS